MKQKWQDIDDKRAASVLLDDDTMPKRMRRVVNEHRYGMESKSEGSTGVLKRRHIQALSVIHTGKESNKIEDAGEQPFVTNPKHAGYFTTDYPPNAESVSANAAHKHSGTHRINLQAIRAALGGMSAREIARQATEVSWNESRFVHESPQGRVRKEMEKTVWRPVVEKEKLPEGARTHTNEVGQVFVLETLNPIAVNRETVSRFLDGKQVRPETVRLIELVAINRVRPFSGHNEQRHVRDRLEIVMEDWYRRKFRVLPVGG
jgi:hypothetical protein